MVQLSFGLRDYTDDIIQTMMIMIGLILSFSILFLSLGIVVSESRETLALMKAFGYTDRECQSHILAPYRFWAYLGFVLGTAYQYGIMEILIGVIKDTVPEKIEHHFDGNVCFGLCSVLLWFMKASFIYPTENSKTNHQRSALS